MPSPIQLIAGPARAQLRRWVLSAFPRDPGMAVDYDQPLGDPGLFGPDSATWRVNADFAGMLSGGLAALMLQTLHPRALSGVWDHSHFRTDLLGRLRRTTAFVGATSYAPCMAAEAMIARVRAIHSHVHGVTESGQPYAADDPALLTWVHVTEAYSFLQGYRRYSGIALPPGAADRYFDEMRRIAEALGAQAVPASEQAVTDYFAQMQAQLHYGERSRVVLEILEQIRLPVPLPGLSRDLFLGAGAALLPSWAWQQLGRNGRQQARAEVCARMLRGLAPLFRAALQDGVVARSCRRVSVDPIQMMAW
jgi:uncharacterized protein (DUF2236 family)